MLQVNPILSDSTATQGMPTQGASNINAARVDDRRYTKFDHSAANVQTAENFSFGDLLDTLNPLQHIPVISSIYRAVAGEDIHPAARVAGDVIYGGLGGVASGVIAIASATGDSVMESQTGHDATGHIVLAMLGDDDAQPAKEETPQMVADADTAMQQQIQQMPLATAPQRNVRLAGVNTNLPAAPTEITSADASAPTPGNSQNLKPLHEDKSFQLADRATARMFPLNPNKLPYGGVIAPVRTASAVQTAKTPVASAIAQMDATIKRQNRLIALAQNSHDMRTSTTVETNPAMPGNHPIANTPLQAALQQNAPTQNMPAPSAVAPPPPVTTANLSAEAIANTTAATGGGSRHDWGQDNFAMPSGFTNDALLLRALGQYQDTISRSSANGSHLDVMN